MNKKERISKFGEVFTPIALIDKILDTYDFDFADESKKFIDPACGDGSFLKAIKARLLANGHSEQHIIENMLYGIEIQKNVFNACVENINPKGFKHNIYNENAVLHHINFPIKLKSFDYCVGNPPYNKNILKKEDVSPRYWKYAGYTTKLAYQFFIVLAHDLLKMDGKVIYLMPISFMTQENSQDIRRFMRSKLDIQQIELIDKEYFPNVMARICIFEGFKSSTTRKDEPESIIFIRPWRDKIFKTFTTYTPYGEIPLFIGRLSYSIFNKVVSKINTNKSLASYKGWNGVDSYAKCTSKDSNKFPFKYLENVKKGKLEIKSSEYKDKEKAKRWSSGKRNACENYDRFDSPKVIINEILYGSLESNDHLKFVVIDTLGELGASCKCQTLLFDDVEEMNTFTWFLRSPIAQLMFTVLKDYNHNATHIFKYLPRNVNNDWYNYFELSIEEIDFLRDNFKEKSDAFIYRT